MCKKMHYMADTSPQMSEIFEQFIEQGKYFSVLGGRQFGKTTTLSLLSKILENNENYLLIRTSFEAIGDSLYESEEAFSNCNTSRRFSLGTSKRNNSQKRSCRKNLLLYKWLSISN